MMTFVFGFNYCFSLEDVIVILFRFGPQLSQDEVRRTFGGPHHPRMAQTVHPGNNMLKYFLPFFILKDLWQEPYFSWAYRWDQSYSYYLTIISEKNYNILFVKFNLFF